MTDATTEQGIETMDEDTAHLLENTAALELALLGTFAERDEWKRIADVRQGAVRQAAAKAQACKALYPDGILATEDGRASYEWDLADVALDLLETMLEGVDGVDAGLTREDLSRALLPRRRSVMADEAPAELTGAAAGEPE